MTIRRLLLENLLYHWRGNLAVLLGVVVGTAVLTGALLVGDSLRGSLAELSLRQLGWVDQALVGGRFLREEHANTLAAEKRSPAIVLQGAATAAGGRRAGRVTILGVDSSFWHAFGGDGGSLSAWDGANSGGDFAVLSQTLAHELGVVKGDALTLHLQKSSSVPRESLLGRRDAAEVIEDLHVTVRGVEAMDAPGISFSLNPTPALPRNVFVPLHVLQKAIGQPGRVNVLLAGGCGQDLQARFTQSLTLDDWNLVLQTPASRTVSLFNRLDRQGDGVLRESALRDRMAQIVVQGADRDGNRQLTRDEVFSYYKEHRPYLSLESRQLLLDTRTMEAAWSAAYSEGIRVAPTLVYLANNISDGINSIPYSIVAALDPAQTPPLGPFLPPGASELKDDEIVLAAWPDSPLQAKPGDRITLQYFEPESHGDPKEQTATFRLAGYLPMHGLAADPDLTPEFPGITDKLTIAEWNPPFPYYPKRVKPRDERYWREYRTTPKAYVTLATGQRQWSSRFGQLTSMRFASDKAAPDAFAERLSESLLQRLSPESGGLLFEDVKRRGQQASAGGMDFGGLFLGFSFFLIAAALLLVGLLFRLNLDRRAQEFGVLFAVGYSSRTVRRLLFAEGAALAAAGALIGLGLALAYAWLLLDLLARWWPGGLQGSFLHLHATPLSLAIGYVAAVATSLLTIWWTVRGLRRVAPTTLLRGETTPLPRASEKRTAAVGWSPWIAGAAALGGGALLIAGAFLHDHEQQAGAFFGGGTLLLTAFLAGLWAWMRAPRHRLVRGHGLTALARLGVRNAARHPLRSLLTAGLLAAAAFLVVAVESFRRQPDANYQDRNSGSGGFALLAESDVPIFQDLNSDAGRQDVLDHLQRRSGAPHDPSAAAQQLTTARDLLPRTTFFSFRVRQGDDASCLNLYQPRNPKLLGVPQALIDRGGFQFAETLATTPEDKANPWRLLDQPLDGVVPVIGEKNTVVWILKKGLGDELEVSDDQGKPLRLRIVALLNDSVFQSELLLSETNFLKHFPKREGYQTLLIDVPGAEAATLKNVLETALDDRGLEVTPTAERLAAYLAVENTYLSTFQALGGLGLVLGALGLAVVLLRSVSERRGELALLRALGFRRSALGELVLAENGFLLVLGLVIGTAAALLAVAPHLLMNGGNVPWPRLGAMLGGVLAVGIVAGAAAVAATLRAPLLIALRRE
jgi:putative ABC transport system permease protein